LKEHHELRKTFLGRSGLEISEIAFGGGVTGGILINAEETTRFNALRRAVMAGINWIDTAPVYGDGASEETIGRHLQALTPRPHISTKVRLEAEDIGDIPGAIERSLAQSLTRLRSERVALFQLHNHLGTGVGERLALTPAQVLGRGGVADTFHRLKEQGLIQAMGLTAAGDTKACLEVIDSGRFDAAQVYYNAINPSAAWRRAPGGWKGGQDFCGILTACFNQNMGALNIRPLAGGLLGTAERPARLFVMTSGTDVDNEVRCAAAVRAALGAEYGTPAQAALRFTLGNKDIASRVIGITTINQLDEAIDALAQGALPTAAVSKLEEVWATEFGAG
jgi:L-galactose dehydrogenase/L-glyceraldehyde 3-phosphate reductase